MPLGTANGSVGAAGASPQDVLTALVRVPGGSFEMGSDRDYPEEAPAHRRSVSSFAVERHPVTNAQFAHFVQATGYLTEAEEAPDPADFPGVDPALVVPGALVFTPTAGPVPLDDWSQWWSFVPGACWHRPEGSGSSVKERLDHPVVHVSYRDASSYARWAGRRLPTEQELEYAMRRDRPTARYAWGEEERPGGTLMANTWQGAFPYRNTGAVGWTGTSPVGTFPADSLGLVDLIGNVWEWTSTPFTAHPRPDASRTPHPGHGAAAPAPPASCCGGTGPLTAPKTASTDTASTEAVSAGTPAPLLPQRLTQYVVKGGSHLCAPEYCHRYRPAARQAQSEDTASVHVGFRCAG